MLNSDYTQINQSIENGQLTEAMRLIDNLLAQDADNEEAYMLKGLVFRKSGQLAEALNAYHQCLQVNPHHEKAQHFITIIEQILHVSNNHYFADPYTDENHIDGL